MERRLKLLLGACGGLALAVSSYRWLSSPVSHHTSHVASSANSAVVTSTAHI